MADNEDLARPPTPAAPKKSLPAQVKPKSLNAVAAAPGQGEAFTVRDLAMQSSGPIGDRASVEKDIGRDVAQRDARAAARRKATDKDMARPYTTTRALSKGGR